MAADNLDKWRGKKILTQSAKFLFCGLVSITSLACAPPALKTTALMPAKFHEAAKLKEIAVLPFDGPGGREFAAEIEGTLAAVTIDAKQYFSLIDRTKTEKILQEQVLSQTGIVDETTAAKVGKMVGAKGIYTGIVTAANSRDNPYAEKRRECSERQVKYDKQGKTREGNCIRWKSFTVSCIRRDALFTFTPKLVEVETGRIIYSNNLSGAATASACRDSKTPLPSGFALIGQAKERAKVVFKRDVAPSYVTFDIRLMDSKQGVDAKEAGEKLDQGMDYVKHKRLDRACELWEEARTLAPNSPSLLYNLAICAEATGDLEKALDLYKKADRALNKPDDRITAGIGRASEGIQKQKMLEKQLKE